jgi:Ni/Co efflux regulator RcnB
MKYFRKSLSAGLALALLSAPLAMAQQAPNHSDDTHGPEAAQHGTATHETTHAAPQHTETHTQAEPQHQMQHNAPAPQHQMAQRPMQQHGPMHNGWHNGDRYNDSRHVVRNWQEYHVNQPPPGYEWVQDGDQLVLISIASGIIASVIANSLYQ